MNILNSIRKSSSKRGNQIKMVQIKQGKNFIEFQEGDWITRINFRRSPLDIEVKQFTKDKKVIRYIYMDNLIVQGFLLKLGEVFGNSKIPIDIEPFFNTKSEDLRTKK